MNHLKAQSSPYGSRPASPRTAEVVNQDKDTTHLAKDNTNSVQNGPPSSELQQSQSGPGPSRLADAASDGQSLTDVPTLGDTHSNTARKPAVFTKRLLEHPRSVRKTGKSVAENAESRVPSPLSAEAQAKRTQSVAQLDPASTENLPSKSSGVELTQLVENGDGAGLDEWIKSHPYEVAAQFENGLTPLHIVIRSSPNELALEFANKILECNDVDINKKDKTGRTALHLASWNGLDGVVERLLDGTREVEIDAGDQENRTALHFSVINNFSTTVRLLIDKKANPNTTTGQRDSKTTQVKGGPAPGSTPLHLAAFRGYKDIIDILLTVDHINVNPRTFGSGLTPLHEACRGCNPDFEKAEEDERVHREAAQLLIRSGAEVNAFTNEGATPLHLAASVGRVTLVELLMQSGADASRTTTSMVDAESLAPKELRAEISEILHRDYTNSTGRRNNGARIEVAKPGPDQEVVCKDFSGFIWPSQKTNSTFDPRSVWDMLYSSPSVLSKQEPKAIWIHLPSNNRTWVEDTFKSLYDSGQLLNPEGCDSRSQAILEQILQFIKESFGETGQEPGPPQRSHFRVSKWSGKSMQHMTSIVLPLVDVDLQQPEYYNPPEFDVELIREEDRIREQEWKQIQETGKFDIPEFSRQRGPRQTHDMTKAAEQKAEQWETDIVRALTAWEGKPLTEPEKAHIKKARDLKTAYSKVLVDHAKTLDQSFHEHLEDEELNRRNGDQVLSRYLARAYLKHHYKAKCSQKTNGRVNKTHRSSSSSLTTSDADSNHEPDQQPRSSSPGQMQSSGQGLATQPTNIPQLNHEASMRQQVLVVQCLRVWKFEHIVVTSYPERLALNNKRTLPGILRDTIHRLHCIPRADGNQFVRAQKVLEDLIEKASNYEPKFTVCARERTLNNAFAGEIAHVSSKVTRCYSQYQDILGRVESNFAKAVEKETSYLVMIDDILDEISMIKRVNESQDHILTQMENFHTKRDNSDDTTEDAPWYGFKKPHRDQSSDLERLEDDAKRVRKSVTTLLELRQRQASTENVVSLREQSEILFQQSKILFIFTGATVVFAPLSWVNSMLALKINGMTPASEWWERWQAFVSSFIGLIGTVALCLAFWLWAESKGNSFFTTPQMRTDMARSPKKKHSVVQSSKKDDPDMHQLKPRPSWATNVGQTSIGGGTVR